NPDREIRPRDLQPAGNCRRTSVDAVEAIGVHIVGKPAGTTDARNENDIMSRDIEVRHHPLYLCEDGVITATRTPSYILIRLKILRSVFLLRCFWYVLEEFFY